ARAERPIPVPEQERERVRAAVRDHEIDGGIAGEVAHPHGARSSGGGVGDRGREGAAADAEEDRDGAGGAVGDGEVERGIAGAGGAAPTSGPAAVVKVMPAARPGTGAALWPSRASARSGASHGRVGRQRSERAPISQGPRNDRPPRGGTGRRSSGWRRTQVA